MTATIIDKIFILINEFGGRYYGEEVTQLAHVLQCGHLARLDGGGDSLIAAALLHDIGQFLNDAGDAAEHKGVDARHEISGAAYLTPYFGPDVTEPIRLHVAAKRYLCAVEPGYAATLSRASILSLHLQGGPMNELEIAEFEADPMFGISIRLRRYDDEGKRADWQVPDLESYRELLSGLILKP